MKTTNFLPLSKPIKWITILASIMILGGIGFLIYEYMQLQQPQLLWAVVLLVVVIGATIAIIPRKLTVNKDGVDIHLLAWTIHVPANEIVKIEHYPHGIQQTIRIVGAGGFFGNLGLFTCKECGKHLSLITDPMDVCIITRKNKMPIVVSIADNSVFNTIAEIQEKN